MTGSNFRIKQQDWKLALQDNSRKIKENKTETIG
jgi:hypothetical protein